MNGLDFITMQFMSTAILVVLSVLMMVLWFQNREQPGSAYWCAFSILLTLDTVLSSFPEMRNMPGLVYAFNTVSSYFYFFLMMGCAAFVGLKLNKWLIWGLFISCLLFNMIGAYFDFEPHYRRAIIIGYNTVAVIISAFALSRLDARVYLVEKYFLLLMLLLHLLVHLYWVSLGFQISDINETLFIRSVTPVYMILILITIGLLLLTLGRIRYRLEEVRNKGLNIRAALTAAVQETNVATKSKSIFLTNMSHELRTPLNIILGFSEALKMGVAGSLTEKQKAFIDNINFGGKRLLVLINDLLSLSNIEAGNLEKSLEDIPVKEIFDSHKRNVGEIAKKYACAIHFIEDFDSLSGENPYIRANRDWLDQVLLALVDNAAKYGSRNGTIWINSFAVDANNIRLTIRDEGHGIDNTETANVFKPFNRAGIDSQAVEGTGAGLAIVKGLVEAMNGKIDFESRKGFGSTFWIDFPVRTR